MGRRAGQRDLVAFHGDARAARRTIVRLSRAGIDGGAIELLGRSVVVTAGRYGDRQTDRGASLALGGLVLRGFAWGAAPGAAFGAVLLGMVASPEVNVVLAGAGGGAFFGGAVGALTGLLTAPTMAASWERTFSPMVPGAIAVGVRVQDGPTGVRVRRVLQGCSTVAIRTVDDLDELPDGPLDPAQLRADHDHPDGG